MDYWKAMGWEWSFTWCGVGSRNDLPEEYEPLLRWVGHCLALLGGVLCTGDAPGSDTCFWEGYELGRQANMPPAQIYYTRKKNMRGLSHDVSKGHHEAEQYATYDEAQSLAYRARGSFEGLFPSGIALHTRNAFQVLSEELCFPRWITVFWAKPVGKKGKVAGGTNTAVQLSVMHGVKKVNLYIEEDRTKFIDWVTKQLIKKGLAVPTLDLIKEPHHGNNHQNPEHHAPPGDETHPGGEPLVSEVPLRAAAGADEGQLAGVDQAGRGSGEEPLLAIE